MSELVRYEVDGAVATVTLDRPESMNSLTVAASSDLLTALEHAAGDPAVRAVVLTGAGRAFCAGQDLREHAAALAAGGPTLEETVRDRYTPVTVAIAGMPKPVVAAVNGMAAGAGAAFAFAADFRLMAEGASLLLAFARIGLSADSGASWTLPRLVGHGRATALLMLAEPVEAAAALDMGLVNAVVPADRLLAAAQELAARLAAGPTAAYAAIKQALAASASLPLAEACAEEGRLQGKAGATADHRAATEAFLGRRPTTFTGS